MTVTRTRTRPLLSAAIVLGIGMGGFFDGIVFHQILQIHNMLSAVVPPRQSIVNMEINMFWDGLFHAFTWITTAIGIWMLWRAGKRADLVWSGNTLLGGLFLGWGMFNLVEGLINHHLLNIHHVVETPGHLALDLAFLASGVVFIIIGVMFQRRSRFDATLNISPTGP